MWPVRSNTSKPARVAANSIRRSARVPGRAGERTSSPDAQLAVRDALRARFPRRPWIDVVSKADLYDAADAPPPPPDGALLVSVRQGRGLPELRAAVLDALAVVRRLTGGGGE